MHKDSAIYVAGHQGMVGSSLVKTLIERGYSNLILTSRKKLDLFDSGQVARFFESKRPEYVILCAAKVGGIGDNIAHPANFLYENLLIQNNVIWQSHLHNVKKLLFLGSSCIYPRNCEQPMKEEYLFTGLPESTNAGYSVAKMAGVELCRHIYNQFGKEFISCIPTNIYGPRDNFDNESAHVIPSLFRKFYQAKREGTSHVDIWGTGNSRREFLYVDDLSDALIFLMNKYSSHQPINVGTGVDISIAELASVIKETIGFSGELKFDANKPDGMPRKRVDTKRINALGWSYKTSLEPGLELTNQWCLTNGFVEN